jgi:flagellar motor switch/type III secretory pathway protein FliN
MTLEALLGEAEVSLAELQGLAAGDVLVLGAALSDPGSIRLVNAGATVARAKLTEIDGAFALVLQPR